jgi:RNA polymerase sigma factor (sigma-70 family)
LAVIPTNGIAEDPRSRVAAVVRRHERTLLRVARQSSLCDDDALDAYQRALEIFVRRVETVDPATEVAWLKVVIRHEAMAIRRARSESVADEELDFDALLPGVERSVDDQIASSERVRRSAEALRALKPDEAKALMMKAHGLSYEEIGERNGWTYTKVNRAITEGRKRFMAVFEGIESGEECERFAPIVEALALGSATASQLHAIRPHLRHCQACRAAVRDMHLSRLRRATLFFPGFLLAATPSVEDRLRELAQHGAPTQKVEEHLRNLIEPGTTLDPTLVPSPDPLLPAPADGGGLELSVGRLSGLKRDLSALFHRANTSDVATGVQMAVTGSSGRVATVAAVVGLCLSSAGIGTVCVVSGVVSDPFGLLRREHDAAPAKPRAHAPAPVHHVKRVAVVVQATATPTPTPQPARRKSPARRVTVQASSKDPSQGTKPTSHEHAPISPAPPATTGQESFGPEAPQTPAAPAPPPATGGEEFGP